MFAVHSLPDCNGNPARASSHSLALSQNTYQYCAGIRHIHYTAFSSAELQVSIPRVYVQIKSLKASFFDCHGYTETDSTANTEWSRK